MVDSLSIFLFQPVLHDWYNKVLYCAILSEIMHINDLLLLIRVVHAVVAAGFLSCSLSGSVLYVRHHITINKMC